MVVVNQRYYDSGWGFHQERHEEILCRPQTYIGRLDKCNCETWLYQEDEDGSVRGKIVKRAVSYVPGLLRIFNEILLLVVEDATNTTSTCKGIQLSIDVSKNEISVYLDGKGIPVELKLMPGWEKIYYPDFLVSRLFTHSCLNDTIPTTGARLTNIFSTHFQIETSDGVLHYQQVFENNMRERNEPQVTKCETEGGEKWTKITFKPDLSIFKMTHLEEDDVVALMKLRVIDVAGCHGVNYVELNGNKLSVGTFSNLVDLYVQDSQLPRITERVNDSWEIGVSFSHRKLEQVSFVNGFATINGGTHVKHAWVRIATLVNNLLKKEFKHLNGVLQCLWVFVNACIPNPRFDSTGNELITLACFFEPLCDPLPQDFSKKLEESGVVARAKSLLSSRELKWWVPRHNANAHQGHIVVIEQSTGELKRKINTGRVKFKKVDREMFGTCKKFIMSRVYGVVVGGGKALERRFEQIRSAVEDCTYNCDIKELEKELSKLSCRVSALEIVFGGASKAEVGEKASMAAVEEGDGVTVCSVSRELDTSPVEKPRFACYAVIVGTLSEQENLNMVCDAAEGEYVNMVKTGNMEPVKVIETAVEESTSDLEERMANLFVEGAECN